MKAMRVRVDDQTADLVAREAAASGIHETEIVRRALWLYFHAPRVLSGALEAPSPIEAGACKAPLEPHCGPAGADGAGSSGALEAPSRTRGASEAPPLPLIELVEPEDGGVTKAPLRTRHGPGAPRAPAREDPTKTSGPGGDPDPDPDSASGLRPAAGALLAPHTTAAGERRVVELFKSLGWNPPTRRTMGVWRREAGGTVPLLALLEELIGKGRLERAKDPQGFVFACLVRLAADRQKAAASTGEQRSRDRARRELDLVRAYLHGKPDDQPHYEQELRELAGDDGLLWSPPTQADLERLEAAAYGPGAAPGSRG